MSRIRKGDNVVVIAGRDKGKRGDVTRVLDEHVVVAGINQVKKHQRPNPMKGQQGGIVTQEASIHASNVQVVCPSCGKPSRIGHRRSEADANGKTHSVRVCRRCNGDI